MPIEILISLFITLFLLVIFLTDHDHSHLEDHALDLQEGDLHVAEDQEVVKNHPSPFG